MTKREIIEMHGALWIMELDFWFVKNSRVKQYINDCLDDLEIICDKDGHNLDRYNSCIFCGKDYD